MIDSKQTVVEILGHILKQHPDLSDLIPITLSATEETSIRFGGDFGISHYGSVVEKAFIKAIALDHCLPEWILKTDGMSGRKYRYFINNLIRELERPRYLEVGSWAGSTAISAIFENTLDVLCIDNWSEFGGPKDVFMENIQRAKSKNCDFQFIERDFRKVDFSDLNFGANVYLFDGPHEEQDQYDGIKCALPSLQSEFILIVDDFNWPGVRAGTNRAIKDCALLVEASIEIRTTTDDSHPKIQRQGSDWHNGYFIASVKKK